MKTICLFNLVISFFIHSPILFMHQISKNNQMPLQEIKLERTEFGKSSASSYYTATLVVVRITLVTIILNILNFFAIFKYRKFIKKRKSLNRRLESALLQNSKVNIPNVQNRILSRMSFAAGRTTIMFIAISFVYIISHIPISAYIMGRKLNFITGQSCSVRVFTELNFVSQCFLASVPILKWIVYYCCNRNFRQAFNGYFFKN